jgi:hypothetical protein
VIFLTAGIARFWNDAETGWKISIDVYSCEATRAFHSICVHILTDLMCLSSLLGIELISVCIDKGEKNEDSIL